MDISIVFNRVTRIFEEPIGSLIRKQQSITKLFPSFDDRVDAVGSAGGIRLYKEEPKLWHFKVASASQPGLEYDIMVYFSNLEGLIDKYAADESLWKQDESGVDLNKLSRKILTSADLKISHNCPSFVFHGFKYLLTQRDSIYGKGENRPPDEKNPKGYGVGCKHIQIMLETLPFYANTLARHIRKKFAKTLAAVENKYKQEWQKNAGTVQKA